MIHCEITTGDGSEVNASLHKPLYDEKHRETMRKWGEPEGAAADYEPALVLSVGCGNSRSNATLSPEDATRLATMLLRAVAVLDARAR